VLDGGLHVRLRLARSSDAAAIRELLAEHGHDCADLRAAALDQRIVIAVVARR
jgi:hypothetical protein